MYIQLELIDLNSSFIQSNRAEGKNMGSDEELTKIRRKERSKDDGFKDNANSYQGFKSSVLKATEITNWFSTTQSRFRNVPRNQR